MNQALLVAMLFVLRLACRSIGHANWEASETHLRRPGRSHAAPLSCTHQFGAVIAMDFLRLLLFRLWSGRPINVEATRQTDGAEPDSEGGDSSPAAAEVRLLQWDLGT